MAWDSCTRNDQGSPPEVNMDMKVCSGAVTEYIGGLQHLQPATLTAGHAFSQIGSGKQHGTIQIKKSAAAFVIYHKGEQGGGCGEGSM